MTARSLLGIAALAMLLAVGAGAFGAHALRARLAPDMAAVWQTAVQYHAWHALGLLAIGVLMLQWPERGLLAVAAWLLLAGIALFSGSLYALALTGVRGLGAVTPFGGVAFLAGWLMLAWACFSGK
jgi:uncharacterized membrane protein YgdD (TMEM256/DUF423 family)